MTPDATVIPLHGAVPRVPSELWLSWERDLGFRALGDSPALPLHDRARVSYAVHR